MNEQAIVKMEPPQEPPQMALEAVKEHRIVTPVEARNESVAAALDVAYQNASTLKLTPEEAQALADDFPDEAFSIGAGGDSNLVYIEHAYLRQRLNRVLGVGAAVPIRRREWAEEFTYFKDNRNKIGVRVYVDLALLVRGCLVGEAIGDAVYYPDNAKTNYSDALESAKSNAFRRCCKEFGVGLQAWMKGWCEGWKRRIAQNGRVKYQPAQTPTKSANVAPMPKPEPAQPTEKHKQRLIDVLTPVSREATEYFVKSGLLMPNETLEQLSLQHVPATKGAFDALMGKIQAFIDDAPAVWRCRGCGKEYDKCPTESGFTPCCNALCDPDRERTTPKADDRPKVTGQISKVTVKNGTKKSGEPWTLYGIKIGEDWYNTFSATVGEKALELEGKEPVTLVYEQGEKGNNAVEIL